MIDGATLSRGLPERHSLLDLLNTCYGWWGDESVLEWTYDQYPGFESEHAFYITIDGELAAFRRVFEKEIVAGSHPNYRFFALGDTCVATAHRGKGLYSKLHAETTEYCRRNGGDFSCTFNRVGNLTYEANVDRGWQFRTLPIRLRIFSPTTVIPKYAHMALGEESRFASALAGFDRRVGSVVENLTGAEKANDGVGPVGSPWLHRTTNRAIATIVEGASSNHRAHVLRDRLAGRRAPATADWAERADTVVRSPPLSEETRRSVDEVYTAIQPDYDLSFRRDREDVGHMLSHPNLDAVVFVELDGDPIAFAPVCIDLGGTINTARVLDVVAQNEVAVALLVDQIETVAEAHDVDMAIALTDREPGRQWARIDRQVMMWDSYGPDADDLATASLHAGLYDLV